SIMELADDIAYGVHDLEDAIVLGNITQSQWQQHTAADWARLPQQLPEFMQQIGDDLFSNQHHLRKDAIGSLVNLLISSAALYEALPQAQEPLIRYNAVLESAPLSILQRLKQVVYHCVISRPDIQQSRFRCQNMLMALFDAFSSDPSRLLPANTQQRWASASDELKARVICDYISGMTDDYAEHMYRRLYASS
ncbi:MAG: dGTPase, partial [Rheinheimera sp.]|nr:dGTPase [Rheinheimera sp.]